MPRCDYDVIFYRVFCITLLAIALTFTVILTNVFVDIDGLLSNEEKAKTYNPPPKLEAPGDLNPEETPPEDTDFEVLYNFKKQLQFEGDNVVDRNKRSIETKPTKYKIKNQKLKRLLSRQLATLLEAIDAEAEDVTKKPEKHVPVLPSLPPLPQINLHVAPKKRFEDDYSEREKEDTMIRMAIQHLLLNGITSHMDLHEVYRAIHELTRNFKNNAEAKEKLEKHDIPQTTEKPTMQVNDENKLMDELENCKEFQQQVSDLVRGGETQNKANESATANKIIINTLIDIKKDDKYKSKGGHENVKGIIKLIYNGKPIEFAAPEIETTSKDTTTPKSTPAPITTTTTTTKKPVTVSQGTEKKPSIRTPEYYLKKALADYANRYYRSAINKAPNINELLTKSRPKRQAPLNIKNIFTKHKNTTKKHQDELFVEIETHIDNRDLKSDKRKNKIIKNLIDKIQNAIYSNIGSLQSKGNKNQKHPRILQIKKRLLTPVDDKMINKVPIEAVVHRQLNPISKIINFRDTITKMSPQFKESNKITQSGFISETKSINSAENGNFHVEYEKMLSEIPQRLQIPLYKDENESLDIGNVRLSVRDIDGTGLAIGFNHYVDTSPESEKILVFDNLAKMMDSFPESFDEINNANNSTVNDNLNKQLLKTMINLHDITKRDINLQRLDENDNGKKKETKVTKLESSALRKTKNIMKFDYGVDFKDLLSLEQNDEKLTNGLGLDAFDRSKRHTPRIRKVWNINNKVRLSKYLNTDIMAAKSLLWKKNKRVKRDVNNILLSDFTNPGYTNPEVLLPSPYERTQDMYDGSNEHFQLYEDGQPRAIETYVGRNGQETFNILSPSPLILAPVHENTQNSQLMSKYPHIIMERFDKSKEIDLGTKLSMMSEPREHPSQQPPLPLGHIIGQPDDENIPGLEDLVNAIAPKTSYKVTVKLAPKNQSQNGDKKKMDTRSAEPEKEVDEEKNDEMEERSKKIEAELEALLKQKETFESLFNDRQRESKGKDLIELLLPFNPPKILHLNKEDVSKLIKTALQKLQDLNPSVYYQNRTTTTTTKKPITSVPRTGSTPESGISINDLKSITNEILVKIERNTNYFQTFLKKLTEKLDSAQNKENPKNMVIRQLGASFNGNINGKNNNQKDFLPHILQQGPLMFPSVPSFDVNKNGTFIPFIYAYQHVIPSTNGSKTNDNLANVVYHGHIHANTVPNNKHIRRESRPINVDNNAVNNTRYFFDELQRGIPPMKLFKLMKKPTPNK